MMCQNVNKVHCVDCLVLNALCGIRHWYSTDFLGRLENDCNYSSQINSLLVVLASLKVCEIIAYSVSPPYRHHLSYDRICLEVKSKEDSGVVTSMYSPQF